MATQEHIFLEGEGDRYFDRNKAAFLNEAWIGRDPVLRLLDTGSIVPKDVLEVGCSNGFRLMALCSTFNCQVTGVEPSCEAIKDGRSKYPSVTLIQGVVNNLPIETDGRFDLVILNFVLHWVDRSYLLRSFSEIDRMIQEKGHLVIGDFYPPSPQRVSYHHLPNADVWTYKQDYASIFTATNLYEQIAFLDFDHDTHEWRVAVNPRSRARVTLLRKAANERYETLQFSG